MTEILLKVALNTITSLSFALFNIFTNCCMNLADVKQQSKYKQIYKGYSHITRYACCHDNGIITTFSGH